MWFVFGWSWLHGVTSLDRAVPASHWRPPWAHPATRCRPYMGAYLCTTLCVWFNVEKGCFNNKYRIKFGSHNKCIQMFIKIQDLHLTCAVASRANHLAHVFSIYPSGFDKVFVREWQWKKYPLNKTTTWNRIASQHRSRTIGWSSWSTIQSRSKLIQMGHWNLDASSAKPSTPKHWLFSLQTLAYTAELYWNVPF